MTQLEDTLSEEMSKILAEEIDWELMVDMIASVGWIKVDLPRINNRYHSIDIELWIDENCRGKHMKRGRTFVFERKEDAEWFSLRWL
jgi:hypothetical protein